MGFLSERKKKSKDNEPPRIVKSESDNEDSLLTNSSVFDGFSDDDIDSNLSSKGKFLKICFQFVIICNLFFNRFFN